MTGDWVRHEPVVTAGDEKSLTATGTTWDTRWSRSLTDGLHAVVTRSYFPMEFTDDDGVPNGDRNLYLINDYIACSDPSDPVETEVWSDDHHAGVVDGEPTSTAAHAAAMSAEPPTDREWDRVAPDAWSLDVRTRERAAEDAAVMWKAEANYRARRQQQGDHNTDGDVDG